MHKMPLEEFLDALASAAPTPGGGGAAAIMGAMGVALISMVANLTVGKKGYEAVEVEMKSQRAESEAMRAQFTAMIADDVAAFNQLMDGYRLAKDTDEQKSVRSAAIQEGLKQATRVPLSCVRLCGEAIRLSQRSAEHGNKAVISDTGAAALSLQAALRSAALNVYINAPAIKDRTFVDVASAELEAVLAECIPLSEAVHKTVKGRLG